MSCAFIAACKTMPWILLAFTSKAHQSRAPFDLREGSITSFMTPPNGHPHSYIPTQRPIAVTSQQHNIFNRSDVAAVNQKLDHVLAIMMEQKEAGKKFLWQCIFVSVIKFTLL